MEKTIINLTGHDLDIFADDKKVMTLQAKGKARVYTKIATFNDVNVGTDYEKVFVPVFKSIVDKIDDLPPYNPHTVYIVSRITAEGAKEIGRQVDDLLIPTNFIREKGRVIGCQSFERI